MSNGGVGSSIESLSKERWVTTNQFTPSPLGAAFLRAERPRFLVAPSHPVRSHFRLLVFSGWVSITRKVLHFSADPKTGSPLKPKNVEAEGRGLESAQRRVAQRWAKNWDTPTGTARPSIGSARLGSMLRDRCGVVSSFFSPCVCVCVFSPRDVFQGFVVFLFFSGFFRVFGSICSLFCFFGLGSFSPAERMRGLLALWVLWFSFLASKPRITQLKVTSNNLSMM